MALVQLGRLIDHVHLVVRDLPASKRFYRAVFDALGIPIGGEGEDFLWADELYISSTKHSDMDQLTGRIHLAFQAKTRAMVERFHRDAIAAGGIDNGGPGIRKYAADYYAAFVIDQDGNNIEAVHHGD